jgi:hypothetical protein
VIESVRFRNIVREYDVVMFTHDGAAELRAGGWIDDIDRGFGRRGEGPHLRGIIYYPLGNGERRPVQVFPGDAILRDEAGYRTILTPDALNYAFEPIPDGALVEEMGVHAAVPTPDVSELDAGESTTVRQSTTTDRTEDGADV